MNDWQDLQFDRQNLISSDHHDWWIRKNYLQCCDLILARYWNLGAKDSVFTKVILKIFFQRVHLAGTISTIRLVTNMGYKLKGTGIWYIIEQGTCTVTNLCLYSMSKMSNIIHHSN